MEKMTLLNMFHELNSFVPCSQHFDAAARSNITARNNRKFSNLVLEWSDGEYDECPELLLQRLLNLME